MIRRYVARARGRALRAVGVPRLPNAPSPRALVQRELRRAARLNLRPPTGNRRPATAQQPDDPANDPTDPTARLLDALNRAGLLDPSREPGDGPDELTRAQAAFVWVGVLLAVYLLVASCGGSSTPSRPDHDHTYSHSTYP